MRLHVLFIKESVLKSWIFILLKESYEAGKILDGKKLKVSWENIGRKYRKGI